MGLFSSSPEEKTTEEVEGTTVNFDNETVEIDEPLAQVVEKLNSSQYDIVLFEGVAINRRRILYLE